MNDQPEAEIASLFGNRLLAVALTQSIRSGLECPYAHLSNGSTVGDVFRGSLNSVVRDIERHPLGILFRRLLQFGPVDGSPDAFLRLGN